MPFQSYIVHAHGREGEHVVRVPPNVVVYALCGTADFEYDDTMTHDLWHFCMSDVHKRLARQVNDADLDKYVKTFKDILNVRGNSMCAFPPNTVMPNLQFYYNDPAFQTGIFSLPLEESKVPYESFKLLTTMAPCDAGYDSAMHHVTHPKYRVLARMRNKMQQANSLHEMFEQVRDSNDVCVIFVLTCRGISSNRKRLPQGHTQPLARLQENIILLKSTHTAWEKYRAEREIGAVKGLASAVEKMKVTQPIKRRGPMSPNAAAAAERNKIQKVETYALHIERGTERRYAIVRNRKWYLDEHRGKYRYVDDAHGSIRVVGV